MYSTMHIIGAICLFFSLYACDGRSNNHGGDDTHAAPNNDLQFVIEGNGTVYSVTNNLTWLMDSNCFGQQTWDAAINKTNSLTNGQCGLTDGSRSGDWRLPTVNEFRSFIDAGENLASLASAGFANIQPGAVWWSSSEMVASVMWVLWLNPEGFHTTGNPVIYNVFHNDGTYTVTYPTALVWPVRNGH